MRLDCGGPHVRTHMCVANFTRGPSPKLKHVWCTLLRQEVNIESACPVVFWLIEFRMNRPAVLQWRADITHSALLRTNAEGQEPPRLHKLTKGGGLFFFNRLYSILFSDYSTVAVLSLILAATPWS